MLRTLLTLTLLVPAQQEPVFTSNTQLVVQTVTVKDKQGRPVIGLTAKDFLVTEDGVPQEIRFFEYQKIEDLPAANTPIRPAPYSRLTRTQIASERPGDIRYKDRRLLALYFDLTAMSAPEQYRALAAAQKFVREQMTPADLLAILVFASGSVQVYQDFTNDRARLANILQTMIVGEDENAATSAGDESGADTQAAFGQNDAEFNVFFTDRQLAALQTAATMLGHLSEKKSLLYFASGLRLNGVNNQAQLSATINAAVRAGVSFWPIDARGLVARAPLGDATQGSPGGVAMYSGATANAQAANFQRSQDTLWTLAADTGGKALLDTNDLSRGIVAAQQAVASYYILGYYTTNQNQDGKFRKVKITLANGMEARLEYRQGYYGGKVFRKFTQADKERQLEDALLLGDPVTELTIALEVDYFQLNRAEYFVPVTVKIPGRELALARRRGAERTVIDFIGEVKDQFGTTISNVRDKVDIKLSGETAAQLSSRPIEYDTGFTLLPGKYKIKFLARDNETGRMGTFETNFTVPNLAREQKRIPVSSLILSSQKVEWKDVLFRVAKDTPQSLALNPLVEGTLKMVPSVTRVFRRTKPVYLFLEAYEQAEGVVAYASLHRGGELVWESAPLAFAVKEEAKRKTAQVPLTLDLAKVEPGEYQLQVTLLNTETKRTAFARAGLQLIP